LEGGNDKIGDVNIVAVNVDDATDDNDGFSGIRGAGYDDGDDDPNLGPILGGLAGCLVVFAVFSIFLSRSGRATERSAFIPITDYEQAASPEPALQPEDDKDGNYLTTPLAPTQSSEVPPQEQARVGSPTGTADATKNRSGWSPEAESESKAAALLAGNRVRGIIRKSDEHDYPSAEHDYLIDTLEKKDQSFVENMAISPLFGQAAEGSQQKRPEDSLVDSREEQQSDDNATAEATKGVAAGTGNNAKTLLVGSYDAKSFGSSSVASASTSFSSLRQQEGEDDHSKLSPLFGTGNKATTLLVGDYDAKSLGGSSVASAATSHSSLRQHEEEDDPSTLPPPQPPALSLSAVSDSTASALRATKNSSESTSETGTNVSKTKSLLMGDAAGTGDKSSSVMTSEAEAKTYATQTLLVGDFAGGNNPQKGLEPQSRDNVSASAATASTQGQPAVLPSPVSQGGGRRSGRLSSIVNTRLPEIEGKRASSTPRSSSFSTPKAETKTRTQEKAKTLLVGGVTEGGTLPDGEDDPPSLRFSGSGSRR
jgi:hypothetical protein